MAMQIPQLSTAAALKRLTAATNFTGGLNAALPPDDIDDGQSPDLCNVWYRNRMLRLRPGLLCRIISEYGPVSDVCPKDGEAVLSAVPDVKGVYILTQQAVLAFDGETLTRLPLGYTAGDSVPEPVYGPASFTGARLIRAAFGTGGLHALLIGHGHVGIVGYQGFRYGDSASLTVAGLSYYDLLAPCGDTPEDGTFVGKCYTPTIRINCTPSGDGDAVEDRSLISPRVTVQFTTAAAQTVYHLPDTAIDTDTVLIRYDDLSGGNAVFSIAAGGASDTQNGITATLDRAAGTVAFSTALADASVQNGGNNLAVTYAKTTGDASSSVAGCTVAGWFGGTLQGETSGTCLFVSGNEADPGALWWSRPTADGSLYFPETNKNYAGTRDEPVTAFGKIFNVMVVFKTRSIYAVSYEWEASAEASLFPIQEVHTGIGCDAPGSVQLIDSALVWADTSGGVWTLMPTNIKDERVVRPLSRNIAPLLRAEPAESLAAAASIDTGTHYVLLAGRHVYLWDYEHTPYAYSTSYINANEALQNSLAWYYWELPAAIGPLFTFAGGAWGCSVADGGLWRFDETACGDAEAPAGGTAPFAARVRTKDFDFGLPGARKRVESLTAVLAGGPDGSIEATLFDDTGGQTLRVPMPEGDGTLCPLKTVSGWTVHCAAEFRCNSADAAGAGIGTVSLRVRAGRSAV